MSCCCQNRTETRSIARRLLAPFEWIIPTAVLVFVPKCPACLAAYVAVWTGIGLSFSTASYLRAGMLLAGGASLAFLTFRHGRRLIKRNVG
jgi:hypothetical protein